MSTQNFSINEALTDPRRVFGSPENLVADPRLDRSAKLKILYRWHQDAQALSVASNEGMDGDGPTMMQRVQKAINRLSQSGN